MTIARIGMAKIFLFLFLFYAGFCPQLCAKTYKSILILSSYHQGYTWTDELNSGLVYAFKNSALNPDFRIEYMDSKHIFDDGHFNNLYNLFLHKYSKEKFDIIIACDNDAQKFLSLYRDSLFRGVPVIYCGINNYDPSMIEGQTDCAVISEEFNIREILDNILYLHKDVKTLFVINDQTTTGKAMDDILLDVIPDYKDKFVFHRVNDIAKDDLFKIIKHLPSDTIILLVSFLKDKNGESFDHLKITKLISDEASVPVYGYLKYLLGYGIVGGLLKSPFEHGVLAGKTAIDVLNGKDINSIPVQHEKFNTYYFDYNQLKKWNIPKSALPAESIIINDPMEFYYQHKNKIMSIIIFVIIQSLIIILLVSNVIVRRRVEHRLKNAKDELESKNEEIQSVVYAASHDLRTPLVNIHGFNKLAMDYFNILKNYFIENNGNTHIDKDIYVILKEKLPHSFDIIFSNILKMETLLNGLLRVSRIGDMEIKKEYLNMNELISGIIDQMSFQIKENNIKIELAPFLPTCYSDKDLTGQIFTNLISNSIKYRKKNTDAIIRIYGAKHGESVYCVEDNGIGIQKEHQDKIFELYYRLNPKDSQDGEGLGLTIVKRILFRLNGKIWVESDKEHGSKFYVALPKDKVK